VEGVNPAAADEAPQAPYNVSVVPFSGGVSITVSGGGSCQGGLDIESIVSFLSSLDAEQLEKDVLGRLGMLDGDGETSYTHALLQRLVTIAKGEW
jgi:hypothetical protein